MKDFQDKESRTWPLSLNVRTLREIKRRVKTGKNKPIDLMELIFGDLVFEFLADAFMLSDILWVCCERQAKEFGVSEDKFFELLEGEVLEDAQRALLGAITDFFPPSQRETFTELTAKATAVQIAAWRAQAKTLEKTAKAMGKDVSEAEMKKMLLAAMQQTLTNSLTSVAPSLPAKPAK